MSNADLIKAFSRLGISEANIADAHQRLTNEVKNPNKGRFIDPSDRTSMCQRKAVMLAEAFAKARKNDFSDIPQALIATLLHQRGEDMFDWSILRLNLIDAGLMTAEAPASKNALRQLLHQLEKQHALDLAAPALATLKAGDDTKSIIDTSKANASDWLTNKGRALINADTIEKMKQYGVVLAIYIGLPNVTNMAGGFENIDADISSGPAHLSHYHYDAAAQTWQKIYALFSKKNEGYCEHTSAPRLPLTRKTVTAGFPENYMPQDAIVLHCAYDGVYDEGDNQDLLANIWNNDSFNLHEFLAKRLNGEMVSAIKLQPVHLSFVKDFQASILQNLGHLPSNESGLHHFIDLRRLYDKSRNHPLSLTVNLPETIGKEVSSLYVAVKAAHKGTRLTLRLVCIKVDSKWVVDTKNSTFNVMQFLKWGRRTEETWGPVNKTAWDYLWNRFRPYLFSAFTPYTARRFALVGITPETLDGLRDNLWEDCARNTLDRRANEHQGYETGPNISNRALLLRQYPAALTKVAELDYWSKHPPQMPEQPSTAPKPK